MRLIAGFLIVSGLSTISWRAFERGDSAIAWLAIALAALWGLALALRWPKSLHTLFLGAVASLCVVAVILRMPALVPLCALSTSLCGWDLALMNLRLRPYPQEGTLRLSKTYVMRCLSLAAVGFAATLGTRMIHIRLPFFLALGVLALCAGLFLLLHRRVGRMMAN